MHVRNIVNPSIASVNVRRNRLRPDDGKADFRVSAALRLPGVQRLSEIDITWHLDSIAKVYGIGLRVLERERSAGRFPPPDKTIGKFPSWRPETIRRWVEGGGR